MEQKERCREANEIDVVCRYLSAVCVAGGGLRLAVLRGLGGGRGSDWSCDSMRGRLPATSPWQN